MLVYMLECEDGSIYTGVARDLLKRMRDHFEHTPAAAAYTRSHPPRRLLAVWECESYAGALRAEAAIKRLSRTEKLDLIATPTALTRERFPRLLEEAYRPLLADDARLLAVASAYPPTDK
jgi:putative endonuclease